MEKTITVSKDIDVPDTVLKEWQEIANIISKFAKVPVSLIMKVSPPKIEVFISSKSKGNPYKKGEKANLDGLYCETVMKTDKELLVKNALKSIKWKNNPDVKLNMISYLGYPLKWPDGKSFGTLCVLDEKENEYDKDIKKLLQTFKELIEFHLDLIKKTHDTNTELKNIRKSVETYYNNAIIREIEMVKLKKQLKKTKKNLNQ